MDDDGRYRTLAGSAAQVLREEILSGELPAGTHIRLHETAQRLEMSAIPLREALQALASHGLVDQLPHRGYRVGTANMDDLEDTYRLRLILDPLAVRLAVGHMSSEDFPRLEKALGGLAKAQESDDWTSHRRYHTAFHFGIYSRAESPWLLRFLRMLWDGSERYQRISSQNRGPLDQRIGEHKRVLKACRKGNAEEAGRLMEEHLRRTFESTRQQLMAREA